MAHLPPEQRARVLAGKLEALTPASPVDPESLAALLDAIRERGWELGRDDTVEGIASLGVPVRDGEGNVIATVSIAGLHAHMLEGDRPRHLAVLQAKVGELERRLAGQTFGGHA